MVAWIQLIFSRFVLRLGSGRFLGVSSEFLDVRMGNGEVIGGGGAEMESESRSFLSHDEFLRNDVHRPCTTPTAVTGLSVDRDRSIIMRSTAWRSVRST